MRNAERALLKSKNTLFDDLIKNVENHEDLKQLIVNILYHGAVQSFSLANPVMELGVMFGILKEKIMRQQCLMGFLKRICMIIRSV